jgi:hypothetical protein
MDNVLVSIIEERVGGERKEEIRGKSQPREGVIEKKFYNVWK